MPSRKKHSEPRPKSTRKFPKPTKVEAPPSAPMAQAPVVGIGASAGGLDALKAFFGAMPPETGLVFVVVVHLDPTHDSPMPELLARSTSLTVEAARDRQLLEANHVYVIPPNRTLTIDQGLIRVREVADRRGLRGAIDFFFRSLAESQRERGIAIVLSGTGTEGTLGAQAVKAEGGMVIAQAPNTASQPGMPSSVIAAGLEDLVLAPEQMPKALLDYVRHRRLDRGARPAEQPPAKLPNGLQSVLAVLRARARHDFRGYKTGTLQRRIERRMGLHQIASIPVYVEYLRTHPAEVDRLFQDLLIGVTSFFRDPSAFDELASKVLAGLVKGRDPEAPIRIWVPGCATGEEAYSIAIAMAEELAAQQSSCRVQIFATDVDEQALDIARAGTYPESIALDVTPARLQRFFTRDDHRFTILNSIRDWMTFAVQNVVGDPPFSRLDLVSCRNVLIYLEPTVQEKLVSLFHFALNPGGYLFLGNAESLTIFDDLFTPISKPRRIFRRSTAGRRPPIEFPAPRAAAGLGDRAASTRPPEPSVGTLADQQLLAHFAPAAVVVRHNGQIVRLYGAMDRYIHLPTGDATLDLLTLARDTLKPALRAALHEAVRRNRSKALEVLDVSRDKGHSVRLTVAPLAGPGAPEGLWLVIFEELPVAPPVGGRRADGKQVDLVRRLEAELRATKKDQEHLVEQLASNNEELKAANEEILSMNEELQSTNEELVTSKEELQSMNEELTTLNAQLQDKVHQLTEVNDDLANLIASTEIATLFLDTEFRIKRFTKAATQVFHLVPSDRGRLISHIANNLVNLDVAGDARVVLERLTPLEKEVAAQDGRQYLVRVYPYRTEDKAVQGVVLTLVNVTALKQTESALRAAKEQVSADLRRMTRLHEISTRALNTDDARAQLDEIVRVALEISDGEKGNIQEFDGKGFLTIVAQHGFQPPFLEFFQRAGADTDSACGAALKSRQRVIVEDVRDSPIFAGSPSLQVLLNAGVGAVQSTPLISRAGRLVGMFSTHHEAPHHFTEEELRWLDLLARQAADVIDRAQTERLLILARHDLEHFAADRTQWLALVHDAVTAIDTAPSWDEALYQVLRAWCTSLNWQIGCVYVAVRAADVLVPAVSYIENERFRPFQTPFQQSQYPRGHSLPGRVIDEGLIWLNDPEELIRSLPVRGEAARQAGLKAAVALPIMVGRETAGVIELFSDQPHPPSEQLLAVMNDLSSQMGKVIERERLMGEMTDLVWREQQDLLHTLHDSLGQTLTALGMLSTGLQQRLTGTDAATAETAEQIAWQAEQALQQVRQLSKGAFPLEIDARNLAPALRQLAATTQSIHQVRVELDGDEADVRDSRTATQMYRIAQEAVTNAVKHAKARHIRIELGTRSGVTTLIITDNGVGIDNRNNPGDDGIGIQIMRFRARSIGGSLEIGSAAGGGTAITLTIGERRNVAAANRSKNRTKP